MNAARLLAHYEQVVDSPDAIVRMERFILDLAVRGKLVPQNEEDEPAPELLKRIMEEKTRLVNAGALRPERHPKEAYSPTEIFELPRGWTWVTLQSICLSISDGDHQPPPKSQAGVPFLVIGNVRTKTIDYAAERTVSREYFDGLDPIRKPRRGDLLYTLVGSFGIPVQVRSDAPFCVQRHIGILRPAKQIDSQALSLFLESEFAFKQAEAAATGIAQKTVSLAGLRAMVLPLPPLAEQHRIVAKVEELRALCGQLEAARSERETIRNRLLASSLARLSAPNSDTFQANAHLVVRALPALTARPDQIKQLRRTILDLAVRGKLVPQESKDEPASKLLERIAQEKARLGLNARRVPFEPHDTSFALPAGWSWARLGEICSKTGSGSTPRGGKEVYRTSGVPFLRSQNVYDDGLRLNDVAYIDRSTHERMSGTRVAPGDLLLNITGGSMGRCCLVPKDFEQANISQHVAIIRVVVEGMEEFLHGLVLSPYFQDYVFAEQTGAGRGGLPKSRMDLIPVALPPFAEQHRIVARVHELLSLCDQIERSTANSIATRRQLLDALLAEALQSAGEFEPEWQLASA